MPEGSCNSRMSAETLDDESSLRGLVRPSEGRREFQMRRGWAAIEVVCDVCLSFVNTGAHRRKGDVLGREWMCAEDMRMCFLFFIYTPVFAISLV